MSRKGNCWDNAVAESFFSSLKKERIKKQIYKNRELALNDVADYIDRFYNPTRRHSHLGGVSPRAIRSSTETALTESPLNPGNSTPVANKRQLPVTDSVSSRNGQRQLPRNGQR